MWNLKKHFKQSKKTFYLKKKDIYLYKNKSPPCKKKTCKP